MWVCILSCLFNSDLLFFCFSSIDFSLPDPCVGFCIMFCFDYTSINLHWNCFTFSTQIYEVHGGRPGTVGHLCGSCQHCLYSGRMVDCLEQLWLLCHGHCRHLGNFSPLPLCAPTGKSIQFSIQFVCWLLLIGILQSHSFASSSR